MIGRVQAESAMIQNEMTPCSFFNACSCGRKASTAQRDEIAAEQWSRKTVTQNQPVFQNKGTSGGL